MLLPVVERQARNAEPFVAKATRFGMRIADGNTAIHAFCYRIVAAGVADRILYVRCFNNSALHVLALGFQAHRRPAQETACRSTRNLPARGGGRSAPCQHGRFMPCNGPGTHSSGARPSV